MRLRLLAASLLVLTFGIGSSALAEDALAPIEDFARYTPQTTCHPKPRLGTRMLAAWIEREYRRTEASTKGRACGSGGASEHKDGRAIDWMLDARRKAQRQKARSFLNRLFAADADGNDAALARRMGVMYVIWNDHMYASYDHFVRRDYLSSSCPSRRKCSATLRHRNHVHISLSPRGGRARTSWYATQS